MNLSQTAFSLSYWALGEIDKPFCQESERASVPQVCRSSGASVHSAGFILKFRKK